MKKQDSNMWNDIEKCPACGTKVLKVGLRNHLIGKAKSELWRISTGEDRERKHLDYVSKNTKLVKVKIIKLKFK